MKVYHKKQNQSYTLGVFPTIELLMHRPKAVKRVVVHSSIYKNKGFSKIQELCQEYHIQIDEHDPTIDKLSPKNNCFAIGVFDKYETMIEDENHIVLVNPMDMGNMGTIMRTMIGFDFKNLVIIKPAVDLYDPKVIRSSMGALFSLNIKCYSSFDEYYKDYDQRDFYPLMLKGAKNIHKIEPVGKYSLVFGNESSGLDDVFLNYGQSVFIPHTASIDSLNLSMAAGLTMFHFSKKEFVDKISLE